MAICLFHLLWGRQTMGFDMVITFFSIYQWLYQEISSILFFLSLHFHSEDHSEHIHCSCIFFLWYTQEFSKTISKSSPTIYGCYGYHPHGREPGHHRGGPWKSWKIAAWLVTPRKSPLPGVLDVEAVKPWNYWDSHEILGHRNHMEVSN